MFIGRPFVLVHRENLGGQDVQREQGIANGSPASTHQHQSPIQPAVDQEALVQDCISAAKAAIEICHAMQTGDMGLTRSSYIEYSSCRAALLVLIAYSISYRTNQFSGMLQRGFEAIREMALTGDSARSEISLLETLEAALHHLRIFDIDDQSASTADPHAIRDDYDGFVRWYKSQKSTGGSGSNERHGVTEGALTQPEHSDVMRSDCLGSDTMVSAHNETSFDDQWPGFDLQSTVHDAVLFDSDFSQNDALEKDLLDSLLWIPD